MLNMHRPPHVLPTMNANVLHTQDRLPRWHHLVAGLRHRQATRPLVVSATIRHSPYVCNAYTDTCTSFQFVLPIQLYIPHMHQHSHRTGHAESLHIAMRDPALSFTSRPEGTNKGTPSPATRSEVCHLYSRSSSVAPHTCIYMLIYVCTSIIYRDDFHSVMPH